MDCENRCGGCDVVPRLKVQRSPRESIKVHEFTPRIELSEATAHDVV